MVRINAVKSGRVTEFVWMQMDWLWIPETGCSICLQKDLHKHFRRLLTATRLLQLGWHSLGRWQSVYKIHLLPTLSSSLYRIKTTPM
jgi:hypothetical protein